MGVFAHSTNIIVGVYAIIFGLGKIEKRVKGTEELANTNFTATALLGLSRQRSKPIDFD